MCNIEIVDDPKDSTVSAERLHLAKQVNIELSIQAALHKKPFDTLVVGLKLLTMPDKDFNGIAKLCGVLK